MTNPTAEIDILRNRVDELERALKPFAEYVKGIEPTDEGLRISIGMLARTDHRGWAYTTDGLCVRDLINARTLLSSARTVGG